MLEVTKRDGVARVTLNRPELRNAFDDELIKRLTGTFQEISTDRSVRVMILAGNGPAFCAGADLNWMKRMAGFSLEENRRDAMAFATLMRSIAHFRKPTIARVHGAAYGGGVGLVACCDIAVASQHATFSISEAKLGLIPAVISPYVIAAIGERAARRYFLTAERFDASEAWRLGLVHEVASNDVELDEKLGEIVDALLIAGPVAQLEAKALIRAVAGRPVSSELIQDTAERIAKMRASPEGREGVGAFLEKRRPSWIPPEPETEIPPELPEP